MTKLKQQIEELRRQWYSEVFQFILDHPEIPYREIEAKFNITHDQLLYIIKMFNHHRPRGRKLPKAQ
jgi:hypothetical protein